MVLLPAYIRERGVMEYTCQYGNCIESDVPFTLSRKGSGILGRFCSCVHLTAYVARELRREGTASMGILHSALMLEQNIEGAESVKPRTP
jgi:hypothetical protein